MPTEYEWDLQFRSGTTLDRWTGLGQQLGESVFSWGFSTQSYPVTSGLLMVLDYITCMDCHSSGWQIGMVATFQIPMSIGVSLVQTVFNVVAIGTREVYSVSTR